MQSGFSKLLDATKTALQSVADIQDDISREFDAIYNLLNGTTAGDISINGDLTVKGGNIDVSAAAMSIAILDANAAALDIKEGPNSYLKFVTTNGSEKVVCGKAFQSGTIDVATDGDADLGTTTKRWGAIHLYGAHSTAIGTPTGGTIRWVRSQGRPWFFNGSNWVAVATAATA